MLSDDYVVFWNQNSTPDGSILYTDGEEECNCDPYVESFTIKNDR